MANRQLRSEDVMKKLKYHGQSNTIVAQLSAHADLLYQALETEQGGVKIYTTALECVENDDLRSEWKKYLSQTKEHVEIVREVLVRLGLDPDRDCPGRQVVRHIGGALVDAMQMAQRSGAREAAEIVAAECVLLAETKDHANWSLIGQMIQHGPAKLRTALKAAHDKVERQEDEHLYHGAGWARELWLEALDLPAELPPPEEKKKVMSEEEAVSAREKSLAERD
jgi:rubrerythrin